MKTDRHPAWGVLAMLWVACAWVNDARARDYHVCNCGFGAESGCVPGDDLDAGTAVAPFRTLERVRQIFPFLRNGDAIRLCRGGAWQLGSETGARWQNSDCTRDPVDPDLAQCEIGSYAAPWGGSARPLVERFGNEPVMELIDVVDRPEDHIRLVGLHLSRGGGLGAGLLVDPSRNRLRLRDMQFDGHDVGVSFPPEPCHVGGSCAPNSRAAWIDQSQFTGSGRHAIRAEGSRGLYIDLSALDLRGNGSAGGLGADVFASEIFGMVLRDSRLTQTVGWPGRRCSGNSVYVASGPVLYATGNLFEEVASQVDDDCMPIMYTRSNASSANLVVGNRFNEFGMAAVTVSQCRNCFIQNNVLVRSANRSGAGIEVRDSSPIFASRFVWIRHNSLFVTSAPGFTGVVLSAAADPLRPAAAFSVASNAIHYGGASPAFLCMRLQAARQDFLSVDYNHCHFPEAEAAGARWGEFLGPAPTVSGPPARTRGGSALQDWWDVVNANGAEPPWDRNSSTEAPGFALSPDPYAMLGLMPRFATDAVVDQGEPLQFPFIRTDFRGRPRDALPDAGAFEYDPTVFEDAIFAHGFE